MTNPDSIPLYLGIPAAAVLWATWLTICAHDARQRLRRIRSEFERRGQ